MNEFTKGEYTTTDNGHFIEVGIKNANDYSCLPVYPATCIGFGYENKADADLYATAGTTATKLAEAGYDAIKVLELLPDIMQAMIYIDEANVCETTSALLKQCRGE